mmetsp:Transcript_2250/g.14924  ORF Transcript_2250/g.14924 Transcript_2250/m.14924 type:complete len:266 (+) Transcript_2250:3070-3867(+)
MQLLHPQHQASTHTNISRRYLPRQDQHLNHLGTTRNGQPFKLASSKLAGSNIGHIFSETRTSCCLCLRISSPHGVKNSAYCIGWRCLTVVEQESRVGAARQASTFPVHESSSYLLYSEILFLPVLHACGSAARFDPNTRSAKLRQILATASRLRVTSPVTPSCSCIHAYMNSAPRAQATDVRTVGLVSSNIRLRFRTRAKAYSRYTPPGLELDSPDDGCVPPFTSLFASVASPRSMRFNRFMSPCASLLDVSFFFGSGGLRLLCK